MSTHRLLPDVSRTPRRSHPFRLNMEVIHESTLSNGEHLSVTTLYFSSIEDIVKWLQLHIGLPSAEHYIMALGERRRLPLPLNRDSIVALYATVLRV